VGRSKSACAVRLKSLDTPNRLYLLCLLSMPSRRQYSILPVTPHRAACGQTNPSKVDDKNACVMASEALHTVHTAASLEPASTPRRITHRAETFVLKRLNTARDVPCIL
jgi:hypothetical protein